MNCYTVATYAHHVTTESLIVISEIEPSVSLMQQIKQSRLDKHVHWEPYYCEFHSHMINYELDGFTRTIFA